MSSLDYYNNAYPTIYLEKNGVQQAGTYSYAASAPAYNLKKYKVKKIDSLEIYDLNKFKDFSDTSKAKSIDSSVDAISKYLSKKGYLPRDAEFDSIDTRENTLVHSCEDQTSNNPFNSYVIHYTQKYDNIKVSRLHNGSYMDVYVENGKITDVIKNWINVDTVSGDLFNNQNLISMDKAIENANSISAKSRWVDMPSLISAEIVYCKNNAEEVIQVWEVKYDRLTLQIDSESGKAF